MDVSGDGTQRMKNAVRWFVTTTDLYIPYMEVEAYRGLWYNLRVSKDTIHARAFLNKLLETSSRKP